MKKLKIITLFIIILFTVWCSHNIIQPKNQKQQNLTWYTKNWKNLQDNKGISDNLEVFKWKITILIWWATWCPHCQKAIPIFKEKIYDIYKWKINIQINLLSDDKFKVNIPQKTNSKIIFKDVVWKDCNYIPSWAILDKNLKVLLSSCWWEKNLDDMLNILKEKIKK